MSTTTGAGSIVDIKLGQVPRTTNPALHNELQLIYNSLHILSQYMQVLRADLEGDDSQTPAENVRFQKFLFGEAKQSIAEGDIVSFDTDGKVIKGTSFGDTTVPTFIDQNGRTIHTVSGMVQTFFGIALNTAAIGEEVKLGVGPAILAVTGVKSGQQVWARTAKGQIFEPDTNGVTLFGFELSAQGSLFLNFPGYFQIPGYPIILSVSRQLWCLAQASPVGVAVADGFVLFSDFQYWTGYKATSIFNIYPGVVN